MNLRQKTITGAAWMVGMQFTVNLLGICSTFVLVRLLTPEDFGVVALAGSAYALFVVLGQFGFDTALIQYKDPERAFYDTAWTANILVGLTVAAAMGFVAAPAASFFADPRIENVVYTFALLSLAKGFENIGMVNFRKSLEFRAEFLYFVLPKLTSLFIGVAAAFALRSYWALVIGMVSAQVAKLLFSHLAQPFRPRLSLAKFGELFRFTKWVLGNHVLQYASSNGLEIILGKLRDTSAVGVFSIARQLAFFPTSEILAPINRALFPSFSKIADDTARIRAAFYNVFGITVFLALPCAFGILAIADVLVDVAFGARWQGAVPLLSVLGFIGAINSARSVFFPLLLARGAPKAATRLLLIYVVVVIPSSFAFIRYLGTMGIAYAMLLATVLSVPSMFFAARREIGIATAILAKQMWRPLVAAIAMALGVQEIKTLLFEPSDAGLPELFALIGSGAAIYAACVLALWTLSGRPQSAEHTVLGMIGSSLRKLRAVRPLSGA